MEEKRQYHSRAYHRYFEGYEESRRVNDKGKLKIERVYVGHYFRQNIGDRERILKRVLSFALYLAVLGSFLFAVTLDIRCNKAWYVVSSTVLSFLAMMWLAITLFFNLTAKREMEIRTLRDSSERFITASRLSFIFTALSAFAVAVHVTLNPGKDLPETILCGVIFVLDSVMLFILYKMEKDLKYDVLPQKSGYIEKGYPIKYLAEF